MSRQTLKMKLIKLSEVLLSVSWRWEGVNLANLLMLSIDRLKIA